MNHSNPPYSHEQERLRMLRQQLRSMVKYPSKITSESIKANPRKPDEPMMKWAHRIAFKDGEI